MTNLNKQCALFLKKVKYCLLNLFYPHLAKDVAKHFFDLHINLKNISLNFTAHLQLSLNYTVKL